MTKQTISNLNLVEGKHTEELTSTEHGYQGKCYIKEIYGNRVKIINCFGDHWDFDMDQLELY